jgi:nuclear transport factor 2 (NTF2) superfamily protein
MKKDRKMTQARLVEGTDDAMLNAGTTIIPIAKARALVDLFARVTTSRDADAVAKGFTEDCIGRFNCTDLRGREQIRAFFAERFPRFSDSYKCEKTLRSISGNVLGVTWHSTWYDSTTKKPMEGRGTEFWVMRGDLVAQWDATFGQ